MTEKGRYTTSGLVEDQYMEGSDGLVLKNLLGISNKTEMEQLETGLLFDLTDRLLDELDQQHRFTVRDIQNLHRRWQHDTLLAFSPPVRR